MADRYWVGGSGTWNSTSTTNWSATPGGASGASVPTAADNVFFDRTGTYTVTLQAITNMFCLDITVSAGTVTFAGTTGTLTVSGSMSLIAGTVWTNAGTITFNATTTGKTITTNGTSLGGNLVFNGVGGGWTLGSAFTTIGTITITAGTLDTSAAGNYAVSATTLTCSSATTSQLNLNASTVTLSGLGGITVTGAGFTFNAGTSQINLTNTTGSSISANNRTFYNVSFLGVLTAATTVLSITGANTFNNLLFTAPNATNGGIIYYSFNNNQTINGTFTVSGGAANQRIFFLSSLIGTARTFNLANPATISNCDFRDITAVTNSITATTGGGDCGGNTNITFPAPKTVYWNLAGTQNWAATGWATSSGGTPAVANFPLAQDTAVFDNTGSVTGTITLNAQWNVGTIDMSGRSTAMTLALGANPNLHGSWYNGAGTTNSGSFNIVFTGRGNTQQINGNGRSFTSGFNIQNIGGTVQLVGGVTMGTANGVTLNNGTLDLQSYTLTCGQFTSNVTTTRTIAFGTGNITVIGSGTVWNVATTTGLTTTGTQVVNVSNNTATATTVNSGTLNEANAISFNFTTGTYTLTFLGTTSYTAENVNFTGFSGTWAAITSNTIYGSLTLSTGMTVTASGAGTLIFGATSGTKTITSNGKTMGFAVAFSGVGGTWQLQDKMTVSASNTVTLTSGTLDLNGNELATGFFSSSNSNTRALAFGTGLMRVNGAGGTLWQTAITTAMTVTGTPNVIIENATALATTVTSGSPTEANSISFTFNSGTYTLTLTAGTKRNLSFNGFTGTVGNTAQTIYGDLFLSTGMTLSAGTNAWTLASTSATVRTIRSGGKTMDFPVTFNGTGGTWQLTDAMTVGSTRTATLSAGTLDLNNNTLTTGFFSSSAATTRAIAFGTGNITLNGAGGTLWTTATTTGLTTSGTQVVNVSYTGATASTVTPGSLSEANSISFNFTTGTYALTMTAGSWRSLNFTGFNGTVSNASHTIYGNLNTGTKFLGGTWTFASTSGIKTITTNGSSISANLTFNGVGGTWQLLDAFTGVNPTLTQTNGTVDLNGFTFTIGTYATAAGTKNLTFNGGNLIVQNSFTNTAPTGYTTTAGTGTGFISLAGLSTQNFDGGGSTYNCTVRKTTNSSLVVTGANTFSSFACNIIGSGASLTFPAGVTNTFVNSFAAGGNGTFRLSLLSSTPGTRAILSKSSGTVSVNYLAIQDSAATGGASWYAGANSIDNFNNTGWIFSAPPVGGDGNFFTFLTN